MPITKLNAMLLFGTVFSTTVFADTALISSAPMTSYFETYTSTGAWTDLQTPAHWITATGEVAYCLQTSKDNPYNAGYYTIDGEEVYDYGVLTGLKAILDHGYPASKRHPLLAGGEPLRRRAAVPQPECQRRLDSRKIRL